MSASVADRVIHRMPKPVRCDECGSPRVALENKAFCNMRTNGKWPLIWFCHDCTAYVGCHRGTDIPLGLMGSLATRRARFLAHEAFDPLWKKGGPLSRAEAYIWMAKALNVSLEVAHISMLNETQCLTLIAKAKRATFKKPRGGKEGHWSQKTRKKRR